MSAPVEGWDGNRPPPEARWVNDRTAPVQFNVRTRFLYSGPEPSRWATGSVPAVGEDGRARHAFARGGRVVRSDVPVPSDHMNDVVWHLWEAIEAFGDDADLIVEVRRA